MNKKILFIFIFLILIIPIQSATEKKPWTVMIYLAGVDELSPFFLWNNMKEVAQVGSNQNCNLLVQIHTPDTDSGSIYFIEKNKAILLNRDTIESKSPRLDSGNPQTLLDFYTYCREHYPSDKTALIIWGFGTGYQAKCSLSGTLAHDNRYSSVISGSELTHTLKNITELSDKKIDLLGFDVSGMASCEFAKLLQPYCEIMVASQDTESGIGWDYKHSLEIFNKQVPTPEELAISIVKSYAQRYQKLIRDYTLSACNLTQFSILNTIISEISSLLIELLKTQPNYSKNLLGLCRTKKNIWFGFNETIDLGYFLTTVRDNLVTLELPSESIELKNRLHNLLDSGIDELKKSVICVENGKNLAHASGLSIYFPKSVVEKPYLTSQFSEINKWPEFLKIYLELRP